MLGLIPGTLTDGKFCKRNINPRNIDIMNNHLANQLERHMSTDDKRTTAEYIKVDVTSNMEAAVHEML